MKCAAAAAVDIVDLDGSRAFLVRRLHPGGGCCPHCSVSLDGRQADSFAAAGRVCCNSCKRWFTWRTGTIFHRMAMDERQLFLLLMLTGLHSSIEDIAAACRLSVEDAYQWQRRINEVCH